MTNESEQVSALGSLTRENKVVIVAEPDHADEAISAAVNSQTQAMVHNGVKHLFLEHDPQDISVSSIAAQDSEYGRMVRNALDSGVNVHLYDDRSRQRERDARYPNEAAFLQQNDPYITDPLGLVAGAENPRRMAEYLADIDNGTGADLAYRNQRMAENIDSVLGKHPNEKALVMAGAAHADTRNDLDEMLRALGHQTTTAEINSPNTYSPNMQNRALVADKPDVIISAETGDLLSYRAPGTNNLVSAMGKSDADIPWRNTETVAPTSSKSPMEMAMQAARNVDCSWASGASNGATLASANEVSAPVTPSYGAPAAESCAAR